MPDNNKEAYLMNSCKEISFNSDFAQIISNKIIFQTYPNKTPFDIKEIRRIILDKKRNYSINIFSFLIGLAILNSAFFIKKDLSLKIIVLCTSVIFFSFTLLFKRNKYELVLLMQKDIVRIKVNLKFKEESKILMNKVNKYIKTYNKSGDNY
jgi:hypothetical protein